MKHVKLLKINQSNINEENEVCNLEDINTVKVGTYNFLIKSLETYRKNDFKDDEQITEFIKVMLPSNEEKAQEQWICEIIWENRLYKAWFATVGGMKQQDRTSKSKCEVIFVKADIDFNIWFENIISLGKFAKVDKTKDMYVNKKILSRISLATSELISEIDMPNIIILPQAHLDWKKAYKTVEPKDVEYTDKGNEKTGVDYDLVDYNFDTNKRDKDGKAIDIMDIFDGGGVATHKVMDAIGKSLGRNDVDFAIIRGFGIAIKGMVTRFNIIEYLEVMYNKTGDTDFCRKVNDKFELLDMYKNWRHVTDNTLLLNESMVKLVDMFENMEEYTSLLEKYNTEKFMDVYNLLNKLYITKVNKHNSKLKQYRRMNYQLMNGLALTNEEYNILAEQDFRLFKKVLKPFDKDVAPGEFITNIDYINLFYNQCSENEKEVDDLKEITNVVDKSNALININKDNIKLSYVKKNLAKLVEKKIRDMAKGRITLKATYNYIAVDPISYMNFAMYRELGTNGLAEGEFYCSSIEDGKTRTIFRNPCMAYSEIHNVNFVRNIFLDSWLCQSEELVYFNDKSDILNLMGSADKDGDSCTMVDNEIVKNAVVIPKDNKYFISLADGKKVPCKFDDEGRFKATYTPSGNLIGDVAIMGASVNNNSQSLKTFISKTNKFYSWEEVTDKLIKHNEVDLAEKTEDEQYEIIKHFIKTNLIDTGILNYSNNADNEILREEIKQNFYNNEKEIYSLLYVSSLVIDSPKTMNVIYVEQYTKFIKEDYPRKANFLQYAKRLENVRGKDYAYSINSLLDKFGDRVQEELLDTIVNRRKDFSDNAKLLQKQLVNENYIKENAEKAWDEISEMFNLYKIDLAKNKVILDKANKIIKRKEAEHYEAYENVSDKYADARWKKDMEDIKKGYSINNKKYYKGLDVIDADFTLKANKIIVNNDIYSVAIALSKLDNVSERFIINFFMSALINVDNISPSLKYCYVKDETGDIEYMYNTYKRLEKQVNLSDTVIEKLSMNDLVRYKLAAEVRFKNIDANLVECIEDGLTKNGFYYLDITKLETFPEFKEIVEGREIVEVKGFMLKKDGTKHITENTFGVCISL
ncbi:hypothetical protein [Clostridium estertheticum]|uniref:Uncharacterized protein n=1 Tax=Clostridium estertheticum TaxID=238834 RepID=A0AA47EJG2_9CLOT|nr:hypothetical protein [Clostridium estertheticum]MBU3153920.1 hypothetical protein [Clostridium estertheticum]WAG61306.1 hypothetical protein LL038_03370 [Clostridium estertheticum]